LPHALIFVEAAERVGEVKGSKYVPYGEAQGAYGRMGESARIVKEAWQGRRSTAEAVRQIVDRAVGGNLSS
jgi:hypothetical protein